MKNHTVKMFVCKIAMAGLGIFILQLLSAVIEGSLALWLGVLGALAALVALNLLCGVLLSPAQRAGAGQPRTAAPARRVSARTAPSLRVVRGGRAA